MGNNQVKITAYIQPKKGHLYAVIMYRIDGERIIKWRALHLPDTSDHQTASKKFREVVAEFEKELSNTGNQAKTTKQKRDKLIKDRDPVVWTVDDAASFLMISTKTVYTMIRSHRLPGVKVGKRYLIPKAAVMAILGKYKCYHSSCYLEDETSDTDTKVIESKEVRHE